MKRDFYRAFEEYCYASQDVIRGLRRQYFPFIKPLANIYSGSPVFDAGCGRGEWLELMTSLRFSPFGVDLDDGMLAACDELGLSSIKADAIEYIASLPDNSQAVVSAFHVVEHITFDQLRVFISESLRVLKPGGMLLMETPNPENILVATRNFYLDPTHIRPIPSMLLEFLVNFEGFSRVKVLGLQEPKGIHEKIKLNLADIFNGVSPDYAIVAQKLASEDVMKATSFAFSKNYGTTLEGLVDRWDLNLKDFERRLALAEVKTHEIFQQLDAVYQSSSWKITAPLRWVHRVFQHFKSGAMKLLAVLSLRKFLHPVKSFINSKPRLKRAIISFMKKTGLYAPLKAIYYNSYHKASSKLFLSKADFSSHASQIYRMLSSKINKKKDDFR